MTAARALGIRRGKACQLAHNGHFSCRIIGGDLGYRFRIHGAHYLADNPEARRAVAKRLTDIYDTRSRLVHGGHYPDRARISAIRDTAEEFVCSGLLRAVHKGFPTADAFKKIVLGLPS